MSVRVRFAPSPTGFLHIGNVRTALINYLYACKENGKFLLRIEDTDQERSTQEAINVILEGIKWLGIHVSEDIIYQSHRLSKHQEAVQKLIDQGKAYRCYASPEQVEKLKKTAQDNNQKVLYPDRDNPTSDTINHSFVVRLKTPLDGSISIDDIIQGPVEIQCRDLDDMVLLRSDGTPTYMLAVVIDDIDMKISHIIRGDDHLINSFRQKLLYEALEESVPIFAHLPLMHGHDGKKLSKRHGALSITDWREMGYPKEVIAGYLISLGWHLPEDKIFDSYHNISNIFSLDKINKAPSRLDFDYLDHLSSEFLRTLSPDTLVSYLTSYIKTENIDPFPDTFIQKLPEIIPLFVKRVKNLKDLYHEITFFNEMPEKDEKAISLLSEEINITRLGKIYSAFQQLSIWSLDNINDVMNAFLEQENIKMSKIGPVIRAAIAGRTSTPDLSSVLAFFTQDEVLKRIKTVLEKANP